MSLTVWQLDPANMSPYYNTAVCQALAGAGCDVRYITSHYLYDADFPLGDSFRTDYVYFRGLNHPSLLHYPRARRVLRALSYPLGHYRILREARQQRPDIIHIQWSRLPRLDYELIRRLKASGLKIVHTVHDIVPLYAMNSSTDQLRRIYEMADALIVHTQANIPDLLRAFPQIEPSRIHIIPHLEIARQGVPPDASQMAARHLLHLPADQPIFLFFGNIKYYKGMDILVEAFRQVSTSRPDAHLVIAGRLDPHDVARLPSFHELRHLPNTHCFDHYIPHVDLWKYFMAADVVVYPYRHIYQSGALITAMGFGRPVIATDVGGLAETIDDNGWIVPPENPQAVAQAMLDAISDPARLEQMGKISRRIIDEKHAGPIVADQLLGVYRALAPID